MLKSMVITTLLFAAAPAFARDAAQPAPATGKKDPNRQICEKVEQTGSRLAAKRVCMTAAQWAEQRRLDRDEMEQAQQRAFRPDGN